MGKSTLTVNLAAALQAEGKRVGVLDADVWGYSIPRMLGLGGQRPKVSAAEEDHPARGARPEGHLDRLLPQGGRGGRVARPDAPQGAHAVPRGRRLGRARLPADRPPARHRRRLDDARAAAAAVHVRDRHDAAGRRAEGRAPRGADGRQGQPRDLGRDREHVRLHDAGRRALPDLRRGRRPAPGRRARRAAARPGAADDAAARPRGRRDPARGRRSRRSRVTGDPPRGARADRAHAGRSRSRCRCWTSSRPARRSPSG